MESEYSPELKDIIEMIHRYLAINKDAGFVWSFVAFEKDKDHICVDCGDNCDKINDKASRIGAYGDLPLLRNLVNELRDLVEDEVDENGFVNV